jgi:hypothetical protein
MSASLSVQAAFIRYLEDHLRRRLTDALPASLRDKHDFWFGTSSRAYRLYLSFSSADRSHRYEINEYYVCESVTGGDVVVETTLHSQGVYLAPHAVMRRVCDILSQMGVPDTFYLDCPTLFAVMETCRNQPGRQAERQLCSALTYDATPSSRVAATSLLDLVEMEADTSVSIERTVRTCLICTAMCDIVPSALYCESSKDLSRIRERTTALLRRLMDDLHANLDGQSREGSYAHRLRYEYAPPTPTLPTPPTPTPNTTLPTPTLSTAPCSRYKDTLEALYHAREDVVAVWSPNVAPASAGGEWAVPVMLFTRHGTRYYVVEDTLTLRELCRRLPKASTLEECRRYLSKECTCLEARGVASLVDADTLAELLPMERVLLSYRQLTEEVLSAHLPAASWYRDSDGTCRMRSSVSAASSAMRGGLDLLTTPPTLAELEWVLTRRDGIHGTPGTLTLTTPGAGTISCVNAVWAYSLLRSSRNGVVITTTFKDVLNESEDATLLAGVYQAGKTLVGIQSTVMILAKRSREADVRLEPSMVLFEATKAFLALERNVRSTVDGTPDGIRSVSSISDLALLLSLTYMPRDDVLVNEDTYQTLLPHAQEGLRRLICKDQLLALYASVRDAK